eukprot:m.67588 g.67588  ORF g.67588 m.67588 type:complete len:213 (-) comp11581_c0_seq5:110-748(-)
MSSTRRMNGRSAFQGYEDDAMNNNEHIIDQEEDVVEEEEEVEEEEMDEIDAPLVFQCRSCKRIVGDTFAWICSDEELNTITLKYAAPSVTIGDVLETSTQKRDMGSTYMRFTCECDAVIGRVYKTTARHLDHIRDLLTFDRDALTSYQLGSGGRHVEENDEIRFIDTRVLREDIGKIQMMIIGHSERLDAIEHELEDQNEQQQLKKRKKKRK